MKFLALAGHATVDGSIPLHIEPRDGVQSREHKIVRRKLHLILTSRTTLETTTTMSKQIKYLHVTYNDIHNLIRKVSPKIAADFNPDLLIAIGSFQPPL